MFSSDLAADILERMHALDASRRALQPLASQILSGSKRVIFAWQRDDAEEAESQLETVRGFVDQGVDMVHAEPRLAAEGSWRAALEEYAEAELFSQYLLTNTIAVPDRIHEEPELFLGALSDVCGELVRRAQLLAASGKTEDLERMWVDVEQAVALLLDLDLTGGLRSKVDQARSHLRRLEEIRYDLAIRR